MTEDVWWESPPGVVYDGRYDTTLLQAKLPIFQSGRAIPRGLYNRGTGSLLHHRAKAALHLAIELHQASRSAQRWENLT